MPTLRQFQAFLEAQNQPALRRITLTLQAFGLSREEVRAMSLTEASKKVSQIAETLNKRKARLEHFITIDGLEYGLHPEVLNATTGEYIDLTSLDKTFWPTAHKAMAILYRPVVEKKGQKYRIEKYTGREVTEADKFLDVPLEVVDGFAGFFLTLAQESELTLTTFTLMETMDSLRKATRGNGTGWFTRLRGRFSKWIK
jgi:hypothetical protein